MALTKPHWHTPILARQARQARWGYINLYLLRRVEGRMAEGGRVARGEPARAQRRERNWARRRREPRRASSSGSTRTCAACSARCTGRQSSIGAASAARQSRPRKRRWGCRARCARPLSSQRRATARLMLLAQTMNQQRPRKKKRSRRPWDGTRQGRRTHTAQRGTCGCRVQRGKIGPAAAQIESERNKR